MQIHFGDVYLLTGAPLFAICNIMCFYCKITNILGGGTKLSASISYFKNILLTPLADNFTCFKQNALNLV